jgi:hypothetical protein
VIERRDMNVVFIPMHANSVSGHGDALLHERVAKGYDSHGANPIATIESRSRRSMRLDTRGAAGAGHAAACGCAGRIVRAAHGADALRFDGGPHSIEAGTLDEVAVTAVLDGALRVAPCKPDADTLRQAVSRTWSELALESA